MCNIATYKRYLQWMHSWPNARSYHWAAEEKLAAEGRPLGPGRQAAGSCRWSWWEGCRVRECRTLRACSWTLCRMWPLREKRRADHWHTRARLFLILSITEETSSTLKNVQMYIKGILNSKTQQLISFSAIQCNNLYNLFLKLNDQNKTKLSLKSYKKISQSNYIKFKPKQQSTF